MEYRMKRKCIYKRLHILLIDSAQNNEKLVAVGFNLACVGFIFRLILLYELNFRANGIDGASSNFSATNILATILNACRRKLTQFVDNLQSPMFV